MKKIGRNEPCPCGSLAATGKVIKYKKCCGKKKREDEIDARQVMWGTIRAKVELQKEAAAQAALLKFEKTDDPKVLMVTGIDEVSEATLKLLREYAKKKDMRLVKADGGDI